MNEQQLNTLEQIWEGKTIWGRELGAVLDALAALGYVEILDKHLDPQTGAPTADTILVRITDEGSAHLSSSGY